MRVAVCLLASLLALWMTVEVECAPGQWNFETITADIDKLVKEVPTSQSLLKRNLRELTKKLRENSKKYRKISSKLAPLVNYVKNGEDLQLRGKIDQLLRGIRAQFVFGQPIEKVTKIEVGLADAKEKLAEEENKYNQVLTFPDLIDHVKDSIREEYVEFTRDYWPTLRNSYPQFVVGICMDIANFKPKWVSEEELEEIQKEAKHAGSSEKEALQYLCNIRHAINMLVEKRIEGLDENIQQITSANPQEKLTGDAMKYEHVRVYTAYAVALLKFGETLSKIASFGQFSLEGVSKQTDGTKLMAMACLLHTKWILPFIQRGKGLEAQVNGLNAKLDYTRVEILTVRENMKELKKQRIKQRKEVHKKLEEMVVAQASRADLKERENAEMNQINSEIVAAEKSVKELEEQRMKLNLKLEIITSEEMIEVETEVESQSADILNLFKTLDGRLQMCANVARKSREEEGRKVQVEAWMELAAMPKAREIPETAHRGFGLFLYQMYLDRL